MRILLLGPVHKEKEFLKQYGNCPFLKGQGQQSWVEALEDLGHEIFAFRYTDSFLVPNAVRIYVQDFFRRLSPIWYGRLIRLVDKYYFLSLENMVRNWNLLEIAKKLEPEAVFISGGVASIFPKTIETIKRGYDSKVFLFSGVNPITSSTFVERKMISHGIVDIAVDNDRGYAKTWKEMGAERVVVLPISAVDPKLHRKIKLTEREQREYGSDVCFVGSLTKERQEILKSIRQAQDRQVQNDNGGSYSLKIWGDILPTVGLDEDLKPYYQGTAYGEKMVKIFNSAKIVLNFQPKDMTHGGNMRTFEIPGCGAFQLVDKIDTEWFKEGKEHIEFKDKKDLQEKITYYLKYHNEREKITDAGYRKAHKDHTYKKHFQKLFRLINESC